VLGDLLEESAETFTLTLSNPSNALLGDSEATGTILDDEGRYRSYIPLVLR
jgi:chitinase